MTLRKKESIYKGERPCLELSYLIVARFMKFHSKGGFFTEQQLRETVDDVIMAYFKKNEGGVR